jgi:hypothetical protein
LQRSIPIPFPLPFPIAMAKAKDRDQRSAAGTSGSCQQTAITDFLPEREASTDAASTRDAHGHLRVVQLIRIVEVESDVKGKTSRRGGDP